MRPAYFIVFLEGAKDSVEEIFYTTLTSDFIRFRLSMGDSMLSIG